MGLSPLRATRQPPLAAEHGRCDPPDKPGWATTVVGVSHCGAGCTLGDIVADLAVFDLAATLAGQALFAEDVGDYLAAISLGIVFQYLAIAPTRELSFRHGVGMVIGFATAWPANVWLIRRGIKEAM